VACTDYTYGAWSGCVSGRQTRTIASKNPSNCSDTTSAVLSQSCTNSAVCTDYTYSAWGTCVSGSQSRTILTKNPASCTNTDSAVLTQSCTAVVVPEVRSITNTPQNCANPVLSVTTTNRAATCQYKEGSVFNYTEGRTFDTTGGFNHNVTLTGYSGKPYYVVCKDNLSGGTSEALKIEFAVTGNCGGGGMLTIMSVTPETQTVSNPKLTVITNLPSICKYKRDANFSYDDSLATAFPNDADYVHEVPLSAYADDKYTFYVACKANNSGEAKTYEKSIVTTLSRSNNAGPQVSNTTTANQPTNNPMLSVETQAAATCQYKETNFSYGSGIQFANDGPKTHSSQLANVGEGQHIYYVVCRDSSSGIVNGAAYQVIFNINTGAGSNCINLNSNDRKNDSNRSYIGIAGLSSFYPWQSVEFGTRDKFAKVEWYAGYQFTANKDGKINQVCGYFDSGVTNAVRVYDGSYTKLAEAKIAGSSSWKCVNVAPVEIKTDKRYYVIAHMENNPIYFQYKAGMFPKNSNNVTIDAGIRQRIISATQVDQIIKYDYMVFGLVDVRITNADTNTSGPTIASVGPSGDVNGPDVNIVTQTEQSAVCRFSRDDVDYSQMEYNLPGSSANVFSGKACGLESGMYSFYARCQSGGGVANNASTMIQFNVK